jgi:hypothetical protein
LSTPFDLKAWLDQHVSPILGSERELELHSVIQNRPSQAGRPSTVLAWLLVKTATEWAPALKRLLDRSGFYFDFVREAQLVQTPAGRPITIFGGDGMPFIGNNGMAMARLYHRASDDIELILEIGHRFPSAKDAAAAVKSFFALFDGVNPTDLLGKYSPPFGAA